MIHVVARILVWVVVLGVGYLLFGDRLFNGSNSPNPLATAAPLYLPPARSAREAALEESYRRSGLTALEAAEYEALVQERQARFWQGDGLTVEQALADVANGRREHLVQLLRDRGLSDQEVSVFLTVVGRDRPDLLEDRN